MNAINQDDEIDFSSIEAALRGELSARAESLTATAAPYAAVQRSVRRDRGWRFAGAVSGLALVGAMTATLTMTLPGTSGSTIQSAAKPPSSLLTIPTRGNLAGDSAFIAAAKRRLDTTATDLYGAPIAAAPDRASTTKATNNGYTVLYANDDGTHRVVIGGAYNGRDTFLTTFVGGHGAAAPALAYQGAVGSSAPESYTFLGMFTGDGKPVPFVVLGPTSMDKAEYATGVKLQPVGGEFSIVRSQITSVTAVDGVAAGEIPGARTTAAAVRLELNTVFRSGIDGRWVDADSILRSFLPPVGDGPTGPAASAIKTAVAAAGRTAGLNMKDTSPGGDAVPDNVAQIFFDLANFDGVTLSSIDYHIDWIGHETAQWDAALLDVHAPGLPAMQLFVRGLTAGAPDSASPGAMNTFVRPAVALTPGDVPHTGAAFGGKPEPEVFGYDSMNAWSPR